MTILHRSLSDDVTNNNTSCDSLSDCIEDLRESGSCSSTCLNYCLSICKIVLTPPPVIHHGLNHNIKKITIITACSVFTTLFLLTLLVLCLKWHNRRRRSIALSRSIEEARTWDFDGPSSPVIIDHPVWHIRTVGLNPTVISSIKVCKYSGKDGVVEGTDCSVCLGEFEEEEMLRLLPKCRHAFHLSCIDTWLRSHTNCPLCRAPIVNDEGSDDVEETLVSINDEETERDDEEEADGFVGIDIRVRRSVSLDSLSGLRVSEVVVGGREKEKVKRGNVVGPSNVGRLSFLKRSISDIGK